MTHQGVGLLGGSVVHFPFGKLPLGPRAAAYAAAHAASK